MVNKVIIPHIRIMVQEGGEEETIILEEEMEADSVMVEVNSFHLTISLRALIISLRALTISPLMNFIPRTFLLRIPHKVSSMNEHLVKFVASLVIRH